MDILHISPTEVAPHHTQTLLQALAVQLERLGVRDLRNFSTFKMSERVGKNGYIILSPDDNLRELVDKIGFATYSRAVGLAMLSFDWGIVHDVSDQDYSIKLFSPVISARKRESVS